MKKLKEKIKKYWENSSLLKKISDLVFYVFIILLLIPATRKPISTKLIRLTMHKPAVREEAGVPKLKDADYTMSFADLKGNSLRLKDIKDKVILLNFWATWCPPCRAEMPSLQSLYKDYGDKIKMILVSTEDPKDIQQFLDDSGYDLPVYIQRSSYAPSFKVSSIPTTFLISKHGGIVSSKKGAANWNSEKFRQKLDELIDSK